MIFFAVISAIRWRVGTDCNNYIEIFQKGEIRPNSREFLWDALVRFVKVMDFHFTIGTGIVAFIQVFLLTYALKKYKYILIWFPVVLFGGRYFLDIMNGVRQMTVACGFVYLSTFIFNRQIFKYILGILILSGIHMSALILIPFYLVAFIPFDRLDLSNRRVLWLCVLIVCFFVGRLPAFQGLINYIEPVLSSTGYEYQSTYYRDLLSGKITEQLSFGPIMISYLLGCSVLCSHF